MKREKIVLLLTLFILSSISAFAGSFITVHYKTAWTPAYIHYKANGGNWTVSPGLTMGNSEVYPGYRATSILANTLEFVISNGSGTWDKAPGGGNYYISQPGDYILEDGVINRVPDQPIIVHYKTAWNPTYMQYKIDNGSWTLPCGKLMTDSTKISGYKSYKVLANRLEFTPNNGSGTYDHKPGGGNYVITAPGEYVLEDGVISPLPDKDIILHYYSAWDPAYLHYKADSKAWTTSPGIKMGVSTKYSGYKTYTVKANRLEFVPNNGSGTWDKASGGANYVISAPGEYVLENGIISTAPTQNITVHYNTSWNPAYIHYKADNKNWTVAPGIKMDTISRYTGYKSFSVMANRLEFVLSNGTGTWDKASGNVNYVITSPGEYVIEGGHTTLITKKKFMISYKPTSDKSYMHYNLDGRGWNGEPGILMENSRIYSGYKTYFVEGNNLTFAITDGLGNWDNNNGSNYSITTEGFYLLEEGALKYVTPTVSFKEDVAAFFYKSDWNKVYMTYNPDGRGEEEVRLPESDTDGFRYFAIGDTSKLNISKFRNEKNEIDTHTYAQLTPGLYELNNGQIVNKEYPYKLSTLLPVATPSKGFDMRIICETEENNTFRRVAWTKTSTGYSFTLSEVEARYPYRIVFSPCKGDKLIITDPDGTVREEIIKENDFNFDWETNPIKFQQGTTMLRVEKTTTSMFQNLLKGTKQLLSEIFDVLTFTQKSYAYSANTVSIASMRADKILSKYAEVVDNKYVWQEKKITKTIEYNLTMDFVQPNVSVVVTLMDGTVLNSKANLVEEKILGNVPVYRVTLKALYPHTQTYKAEDGEPLYKGNVFIDVYSGTEKANSYGFDINEVSEKNVYADTGISNDQGWMNTYYFQGIKTEESNANVEKKTEKLVTRYWHNLQYYDEIKASQVEKSTTTYDNRLAEKAASSSFNTLRLITDKVSTGDITFEGHTYPGINTNGEGVKLFANLINVNGNVLQVGMNEGVKIFVNDVDVTDTIDVKDNAFAPEMVGTYVVQLQYNGIKSEKIAVVVDKMDIYLEMNEKTDLFTGYVDLYYYYADGTDRTHVRYTFSDGKTNNTVGMTRPISKIELDSFYSSNPNKKYFFRLLFNNKITAIFASNADRPSTVWDETKSNMQLTAFLSYNENGWGYIDLKIEYEGVSEPETIRYWAFAKCNTQYLKNKKIKRVTLMSQSGIGNGGKYSDYSMILDNAEQYYWYSPDILDIKNETQIWPKNILDAPTNLTTVKNGYVIGNDGYYYTKYILSWNKVVNATKYTIYSSDTLTGPFVVEGHNYDNSDTYYSINMSIGKKYFQVEAENQIYRPNKSQVVSIDLQIMPGKISDVVANINDINIHLYSAKGSDAVKIYRSDRMDGEYLLIKSIKTEPDNYYSDVDVKLLKKYFYKIRCVKNGLESDLSEAMGSELNRDYEMNMKISNIDFNKYEDPLLIDATIEWKKINNSNYIIYYKDGQNGEYKKLTTTADTKYIDKMAKSDRWYAVETIQ